MWGGIVMEIQEKNVMMDIDSVNAWAVKDLGYFYCGLLNKINSISNVSIRKEAIERCLIYLITWVQKLGKYSGVIYSNFYAEKMELETRVDHVIIHMTSAYAKDYKNLNLFLGVLLDGIIGMDNAIERHKFVVKIMEESAMIFDQLKSRVYLNRTDSVIRLAQ